MNDGDTVITGPAVQISLLSEEFSNRGWITHVLAFGRTKTGVENFRNYKIHWIPARRYAPILNFWSIRKKLAELQPDVVYQRGRDVLTGFAAWYCKSSGSRFIWASAGEEGLEKFKYRDRYLKRKQPSYIKRILGQIEYRLNDRLFHYGISSADIVIAQTELQKERARNIWKKESLVIKSGHPLIPMAPKMSPIKILWISSIKPIKRPELFIELASRCMDLPVEFIMAGQFSNEKWAKAVFAKAPKNFKYLGAIPFEKSQEQISSAHVLVNTTDTGYEGLPNAFVQACIGGTVILSLNSNPDNMLTQGCGFFSRDLVQMEKDLRSLVSNQSLMTEMSANARRLAEEKFDIHVVAGELEKVFLGQNPLP